SQCEMRGRTPQRILAHLQGSGRVACPDRGQDAGHLPHRRHHKAEGHSESRPWVPGRVAAWRRPRTAGRSSGQVLAAAGKPPVSIPAARAPVSFSGAPPALEPSPGRLVEVFDGPDKILCRAVNVRPAFPGRGVGSPPGTPTPEPTMNCW